MATIKDVGRGSSLVSWYDTNGKQHRRTLLKKAAQTLYDQVCAQKIFENSGLHPKLGAKAQNFKTMTVRDVAMPYRKYLAGTKAFRNVSYIDHILRRWGDWRISQITPGQVRFWLFEFLNGPVQRGEMAISTVKKIARYFSRIFSYAIKELEILTQNPLTGLINDILKKKFRKVKKRTKTITAEQFWDLVKDFPKWMQRVCLCGWCSGLREEEILSLTWNKLNLVERLIDLEAVDTKEGDAKKAGIEQELYDVLIEIQTERGMCKPYDFVFLSVKGRKINQNFFGRRFRKLADKAGFTDLKFHDFRHCYTVRKRREGYDRSVIRAQTGHHSDSMFSWYDKVDQFEIQEMAGFTQVSCEAIQDLIDQLVKTAKDHSIPLGAVQALIGRLWRTAA